jgi:retron-type reverse transcriptase
MQNAETVLKVIQRRGQRGLPLQRIYRQLLNPDLYRRAYARLYRNHGALTPGTTPETADEMSLSKIDRIIDAVRHERYRWRPARRVYIAKRRSTKRRPLGLPSWSDKLLQEVVRSILDAYYEPQFREARISVGSTRQEWEDLPLLPVPIPAAIEHQRAQRS